MQIQMDMPAKEEYDYLQLRLKCEAYGIHCDGESMSEGQVVIGGRFIYDYL